MRKRPNARKYDLPGRNAPCLCGSGQKFKSCCSREWQELPTQPPIYASLSSGEHEEALRLARRAFTRYTIWHQNHTVTALFSGFGDPQYMVKVDIRALGHFLESLRVCYEEVGIAEEFPAVLERVSDHIRDQRWKQEIALQRAYWTARDTWEDEEVRRALGDQPPSLEDVINPEYLQVYLDVHGDELGFSAILAMTERIIEIAETTWDRLQYRVLRGVLLTFIGDSEAGTDVVLSAVREVKESTEEPERLNDQLRWARALSQAGYMADDHEMLSGALPVLEEGLTSDDLTASGRAAWHRTKGEVYQGLGELERAKEALASSLDFERDPYTAIQLARVHIQTGDRARARELLQSLPFDDLDTAHQVDHVFVHYGLLVQEPEHEDREMIVQRLKELSPAFPMHRDLRANMLLALAEERAARKAGSAPDGRRTLRALWESVLLAPNFFGLGVDLKPLIGRYRDWRRERQDPAS